MKYKPRFVAVDAMQFLGNAKSFTTFVGGHGRIVTIYRNGNIQYINILVSRSRIIRLNYGDWLVCDENGVYKKYTDAEFVEKYEPVEILDDWCGRLSKSGKNH